MNGIRIQATCRDREVVMAGPDPGLIRQNRALALS